MRKTITTMIDDIDGTEAAETIRFALDGTSYEIDLSEKNASALRDAVAPYAMRAKTAGRQPRTRTTLRSSRAIAQRRDPRMGRVYRHRSPSPGPCPYRSGASLRRRPLTQGPHQASSVRRGTFRR